MEEEEEKKKWHLYSASPNCFGPKRFTIQRKNKPNTSRLKPHKTWTHMYKFQIWTNTRIYKTNHWRFSQKPGITPNYWKVLVGLSSAGVTAFFDVPVRFVLCCLLFSKESFDCMCVYFSSVCADRHWHVSIEEGGHWYARLTNRIKQIQSVQTLTSSAER